MDFSNKHYGQQIIEVGFQRLDLDNSVEPNYAFIIR